MLDPRLLRAFVTIADTGSFTTAADRLHMTQSTISQQVARLEETIGRPLIDRAARPVQLTATGERLLGHARRILALQSEAVTLLADTAGTASVRIGMPDDIATTEMTRMFAAFSKRHREVRLDVTTGLSIDLTKRYRGGEFDIVVVKEGAPSSDHLAAYPEPIAWYAAEDIDWSDPVPLVTFPPGGLYRDAMFERIERERKRWYVAFTSSSLGSVLSAVEAGLGLSLLPSGTTRGRQVREFTEFGTHPAMVVSLYSWEAGGIVGELAAEMQLALKARFGVA